MPVKPETRASDLKSRVCTIVDQLASELIDISRAIHGRPELAFDERYASQLLASSAERAGMKVVRGAYGLPTAFSAEFGQNKGACVALISEYDALPGIGHGCGHNVIAAIGLGSALALNKVADALPGSFRYLGTPAEERGCGKELMARQGAFDGTHVAMMLHPFHVNAKAIRTIYLGEVKAVFKGRAGHAALGPESTRNALDAVVMSYQAIANLRQHLKKGEQVTGVITSGGEVPNVFPVTTSSYYYARAADPADLSKLKAKVDACLRAGALSSGCEIEISWSDADYAAMNINIPLADAYEKNARALGREFTDYMELPIGGADMGNVSLRVPVLHSLIECAPPDAVIHTPDFARWMNSDRAEKAIVDGAKAMAMTAIDFMVDDELREAVTAAQATFEGRSI